MSQNIGLCFYSLRPSHVDHFRWSRVSRVSASAGPLEPGSYVGSDCFCVSHVSMMGSINPQAVSTSSARVNRSEERRVGKEC